MVAKAEIIESSADRMKLIGAAALVVGGLILFYLFGEFSFLYRVLAFLVVLGCLLYTSDAADE